MPAAGDEALVGRAVELGVLDDFVGSAFRSGGVHLVTGDAGAGKSALLRAAVTAAGQRHGARVLHASGVEFEADLGYAALQQLVLPVVDAPSGDLGTELRVVRAAFGMEQEPAPEPVALTAAVVGLLRRLRRTGPLLLVVDDLQWVDRSTLLLLSLVARRLDDSGVALLLAQRTGHETFFDGAGLPTLELAALADEDAHDLVRRCHPHLHPSVRRRIVADAGGNPLALVELPRGLTAAQEQSADLLPSTLPLSLRLRRLFAARIAALPTPSRLLLLLAALHYGDEAELMRIVAGASADLDAAETAGLVAVDPGARRLVFTHPLIRAAVVDLASAPERRSAHRRLAQLTSVAHVRALHLAESVLGTDDTVAELLDEVADAALSRGDPGRAVTVLLRAADLTSVAADRARRLAAAAYLGSNVTGTLAGASALLERARTADPDAMETLQAATAAAAHLLNSDGGVDTAHALLTRALAALPPDHEDPRALQEAVHTLMLVCAFGGQRELWTAFEDAVTRSSHLLTPGLRLAAVTFADPARSSAEQLAELDALVASVDDAANPVLALEVALAGEYVDREPASALDEVVLAARTGGGPVALAVQALVMRAMTAFHEGRWDDAAELSDEGVALCREHGYRLLEWGVLNPRMLLAAARGDAAYLAGVRERLHQWAIPRRMMAARTFTANVDGLAALSHGRYVEAYAAYASIAEPGTLPPYEQVLVWNVLDVVEAAVHSGHLDRARAHAAAAAATLAPISPRMRCAAAAAAALVAAPGAHEAFDRVVDDPGSARWPFQLARVERAYGERLRLDRSARAARPHLERALELFTELGAEPWVARTEADLLATGRTRHQADPVVGPRLTPQELQVARLAATGLSNREIGERLHLSPRTVGAHLYRLFPKLGVSSRAALRDALSAYGD